MSLLSLFASLELCDLLQAGREREIERERERERERDRQTDRQTETERQRERERQRETERERRGLAAIIGANFLREIFMEIFNSGTGMNAFNCNTKFCVRGIQNLLSYVSYFSLA